MGWGSRSSRYEGRGYGRWAPYVPVAERRRSAAKKVASLAKKGEKITPVVIAGRTIASTFWGKSWCENLESYSDFENRLPRGRTYVRNGSVVHLKLLQGKIEALVSGSSLYKVEIGIKALEETRWKDVISRCTGKIESLLDLLQGKLSKGVMETVTSQDTGLFPTPRQITLKCSCPDGAYMCKHIAATLYGVGSRLDHEPELLFLLRGVDHLELIANTSTASTLGTSNITAGSALDTDDLGSLFGIELDVTTPIDKKIRKKTSSKKKAAAKKASPSKSKSKTVRSSDRRLTKRKRKPSEGLN